MTEADYLSLALNAGRIMLESGAETYRTEDTMKRILNHLGLSSAVAFVTTTGIFVSHNDNTMLHRVKRISIRLDKIAKTNDLSRQLVNNELTPEEATARLKEIDALKPHQPIVRKLATAVCCFCFAYIYGGGLADALCCFIVGFVLSILLIHLEKKGTAGFMRSLLGGLCVALTSLSLMSIGVGAHTDTIIISSLMPLVPGVVLTNSVRDIIEGDYLSGSGRILDAFLVATAIAIGVGSVLTLWIMIFGGGNV